MRRVGAWTLGRDSQARSGRPPRETIAWTAFGLVAAARSAAAAPVLAPKRPMAGAGPVQRFRQALMASKTRLLRSSMLKAQSRFSVSLVLRRSMRSVAKPEAWSAAATCWFLGLNRPLPLPCAKRIRAVEFLGRARVPATWWSPPAMVIS